MSNRKPLSKLLVSGADTRNPGRFRGRSPAGGRPVGKPYADMSEAECRHWRELTSGCPWITARHRVLLRMTCTLAARNEAGTLGVTASRLLVSLLAKLGATPVDEARLGCMEPSDADDPAEAFFRAGGKTQ